MSDDRITESSNSPPCPVCATGFTSRLGASCSASGRKTSLSASSSVPDVPWDHSEFRLSSWIWTAYAMPVVAVGLLLAIAFLVVAATSFDLFMEMVTSPGVYIFLVLLLFSVVIRTIRITARPEAAGAGVGYLLCALFVSFGVATLAGLASAIAFSIVCIAIAAGKGNILGPSPIPAIVGGVVGLALFVFIFVRLWPRRTSGSPPASPDPENRV